LIKDILKDFEDAANDLLKNVQSQVNVGELNAYQVVDGVLKQTEAQLNDVLDKTFKELDDQRKALFTDLNDAISKVNNDISTRQYEADVELNRLMSRIEFWKGAMPFMIAGIKGLSQVKHSSAADYTLIVYGNGIGIDEGDVKYHLAVTINGVPVNGNNIEPLPTGVIVHMPKGTIEAMFKQSEFTRVPIVFSDIIDRPCAFPFGFLTCHDHYMTNFYMTLYPMIGANVVLESFKNEFIPGTVHSVQVFRLDTPDKHNNGNVYLTTPPYPIPPNYLLVGWVWPSRCIATSGDGGECVFNFGLACHPAADSTSIYCDGTFGSHPHTLLGTVSLADKVASPKQLQSFRVGVTTDEYVKITYPANADSVRLRGTTVNGLNVYLSIKPQVSLASSPVDCQPPQQNGPIVEQFCRAVPILSGPMYVRSCRTRPG
jgi:hypothetical protein